MRRCAAELEVEEWGLLPAGPRVEVRCDLHSEHGGDHIAKLVGLQDETYWIEWEADRASCPEEER